MCGIAGILRTDGRAVDRAALVAMRDAMIHRGPDDEGIWIANDGGIGLGFRRLSIIDLSDDANQPMANEDGSIQVVFNGEIYNHMELRRELMALGHRFRTDHSDTEVLVHGYAAWGANGLLRRLVGMFAFAVWDARARRLTLARDRVGIKPLYFARRGGQLLFASEIKSLLAHPNVTADVAPAAMYHYLTYLTTPAPLTMFDGIYKLPAAGTISIDAKGRMSAGWYWSAEPGRGVPEGALDGLSAAATREFYVRGVRERLERAVERRMMSDVPYGAFLSGGIDSSVNVALMKRFTDKPVNTFTVGFEDHPEVSELGYAARVAREFDTNHHEVTIGEADMTGYLDQLVQSQDEPLADWVCIPLHFVSKLAHDSGVKVIQVGEGSDEQFCGYNSYMRYLQLDRFCFRPFRTLLPPALQHGGAALAMAAARKWPAFEFYADAVVRAADGHEPFWSGAIAFWESQKDRLLPETGNKTPDGAAELFEAGILPESYLEPDSYGVAESFLAPFDRAWPDSDQLTRMIHNEFRLRLPELLLMRVDKITMAQSLEARVPFLDHELVEFTMDIPQAVKLKGGKKGLLKQAVRGIVPDDVIDRPKMGFSAPMADWLRGDFGARAEAEIMNSPLIDRAGFDRDTIAAIVGDHRQGKRDASLLVWTLYNLTAWYGHWVDRR